MEKSTKIEMHSTQNTSTFYALVEKGLVMLIWIKWNVTIKQFSFTHNRAVKRWFTNGSGHKVPVSYLELHEEGEVAASTYNKRIWKIQVMKIKCKNVN